MSKLTLDQIEQLSVTMHWTPQTVFARSSGPTQSKIPLIYGRKGRGPIQGSEVAAFAERPAEGGRVLRRLRRWLGKLPLPHERERSLKP